MDLLTFCPAPEILTLALPCPEDFYPCPAPPRPVGKNLAPSIPALDTFGFPVGVRSAARRAVFWHRLPKMVLFGAKNAVFSAPNPFLRDAIQLFCHFHDGTPKRQGFCVEPVAQWASGRPPRPIFGPKIFIFLCYIHITPIFWGCTNPTQWNHKSPISWGNFG